MPERNQGRRGRLMLVLVAAVFFGPLLLAIALYFFGSGLQPQATTEHGELLSPVLQLSAETVEDADGNPATLFRGRWVLVLIAAGDCGDTCREALVATRQVRRSLGRDMQRVERVLCTFGRLRDLDTIRGEHPGLIVVGNERAAARQVIEATDDRSPGDVYLVDPLGNLVMRFSPGTGMRGMQEDLKKLLRVSRIG